MENIFRILFKDETMNPYVSKLVYFVTFIGFVKLLYIVIAFLKFINRQFIRGVPNLFRKYGDTESYAVVTGGSDGIGL